MFDDLLTEYRELAVEGMFSRMGRAVKAGVKQTAADLKAGWKQGAQDFKDVVIDPEGAARRDMKKMPLLLTKQMRSRIRNPRLQ